MNQRRILWWSSVLLVASVLLFVSTGVPVARGQSATPAAVTAPAPDWRFVVHGMQDPYAGVLTTPAQPAPGMRSVGVEVEVVNDSVQPLTFDATSISLRDDAGFSYRGGTAVGSEPALPGRTMPGGERARGWVWFAVPEGATLREIVFVPSAPELRVGLDAVATIPGTPGSATTATVVVTPAPAVTATQPAPPTVTPLPTEVPAAAVTTTAAPGATVIPTSVIIIEGAETPEGAVAATATPAATSTPAPVATAIPLATSTPAIVPSAPTATARGGDWHRGRQHRHHRGIRCQPARRPLARCGDRRDDSPRLRAGRDRTGGGRR